MILAFFDVKQYKKKFVDPFIDSLKKELKSLIMKIIDKFDFGIELFTDLMQGI